MESCYCDYESLEFSTKETRKARKQHRCVECRREIQPGEIYEHVYGKWEGEVCVFKTCSHCLELRQHTLSTVPCFCFSYGELRVEALDTLWHYKCEAPGAWFKAARLVVTTNKLKRGGEA